MKMNIVRNKMGKKAVAALMAVMIMSAPVTSVSFAAEDGTGELSAPQVTTEQAAPEKPEAASHEDNDKIEDYNKKVDAYNETARQYNESVDREYEAAVEETNRMNEEIDRHNAAEQQRVKDAEERNAQALKAAEEENQKIDEENAAEKDRVDQINKEEEEKAKASEEARADAEAQNRETEEHNAKVDQYNADMEQYEKDLAQYEYDRKIEAQILKLGYGSVEQYNAAIDRAYNEPAKKSVEKNASAKEVSISDTYTVKEAAEKSGVKVIVHIEHNFQGIGLSYTEDFEIDANDVITVTPISTIGEQTSPGYATFYYNTDEQHQMGYWMEAYSSVGSNARYSQSGWNCGDTHEISYKNGKNHASDKEEIVVEYNYMWNPLKVYKTYNTPNEPTMPEDPGEARELVDVPELYAPNYATYEAKQHVTAEQEEVSAADLWDYIESPVKKAYMTLMDHMALFEVPEIAEPEAEPAVEPEEVVAEPTVEPEEVAAEPTVEPEEVVAEPTEVEAETATEAEPAVEEAEPEEAAEEPEAAAEPAAESEEVAAEITLVAKNASPAAANTAIVNEAMPLAAADTEAVSESAVPMTIMDSETPQASTGAWALINLLCAMATALLSLIMMAVYFGKRRNEDEQIEEENISKARIASLIPAIGAIIAFILTEDMSLPMAMADKWTVLMIAILAIQAGVGIFAKIRDNEEYEKESEVRA